MHKKNYEDDKFSRDYMGIRRKPKLLIETEGWTKYNECFDGFFLFGLRVALVYFWPEEGHLS